MPAPMTLANLAVGPGIHYWAPLGTALPADTVVASVFSDAWPVGWVALGATEDGSEWSYEPSTDTVDVAEALDPARIVTTGRNISLKFALAEIHPTNLFRVLNGGTKTTTGATTTTLTTYVPPALGAEVRCMLGWQSDDTNERLILKQCFQRGSVTVKRAKAPAKALFTAEFGVEAPSDGSQPFRYSTSGAVRV